jgi:hypothetical protein
MDFCTRQSGAWTVSLPAAEMQKNPPSATQNSPGYSRETLESVRQTDHRFADRSDITAGCQECQYPIFPDHPPVPELQKSSRHGLNNRTEYSEKIARTDWRHQIPDTHLFPRPET